MAPTAFFYDETGSQMDQTLLGDLGLEQLKELLREHGFDLRKPKLEEPQLTGETTIGGIHYKYYGKGKLYNEDVQEFMGSQRHEGKKGRLLTIPCRTQEEKIKEWIHTMNPSAQVWLGANDALVEGNWRWNSNDEVFYIKNGARNVKYSNWREGEPNNADFNEHCATVSFDPVGWNDVNCENEVYQVILEFGPHKPTECETEGEKQSTDL